MRTVLSDAFILGSLGLIVLGCLVTFEILRPMFKATEVRKSLAGLALLATLAALGAAILSDQDAIHGVRNGALQDPIDSPES